LFTRLSFRVQREILKRFLTFVRNDRIIFPSLSFRAQREILKSGNFRLQEGSPAIDAGNDLGIPSGITTDLGGNPRIVGAAVDMGAYELAPEISLKQGTTDIASAGSYDFGSGL